MGWIKCKLNFAAEKRIRTCLFKSYLIDSCLVVTCVVLLNLVVVLRPVLLSYVLLRLMLSSVNVLFCIFSSPIVSCLILHLESWLAVSCLGESCCVKYCLEGSFWVKLSPILYCFAKTCVVVTCHVFSSPDLLSLESKTYYLVKSYTTKACHLILYYSVLLMLVES